MRWTLVLHRWIGLAAAIFVLTAALTGAALLFSEKSIFELMHVRLLVGTTGEWIVNIATVAALFLIPTGLLLWCRSPRFALHSGRSQRATIYDLHNITGFYASFFVFVLAATGLLLTVDKPRPPFLRLEAWRVPDAPLSTIPPAAAPLPAAVLRAKVLRLTGGNIARVGTPADARSSFGAIVTGPELSRRRFVYLDQYTGAILRIDDSRNAPVWYQLRVAVLAIHTGKFGGLAGKALVLTTALVFAVIATTGALMWWLRKFPPGKRT